MKLVRLITSLFNVVVAKALECVSVVNEKCMARPKIIDTNANEPVFYVNVLCVMCVMFMLK